MCVLRLQTARATLLKPMSPMLPYYGYYDLKRQAYRMIQRAQGLAEHPSFHVTMITTELYYYLDFLITHHTALLKEALGKIPTLYSKNEKHDADFIAPHCFSHHKLFIPLPSIDYCDFLLNRCANIRMCRDVVVLRQLTAKQELCSPGLDAGLQHSPALQHAGRT